MQRFFYAQSMAQAWYDVNWLQIPDGEESDLQQLWFENYPLLVPAFDPNLACMESMIEQRCQVL
jgi:hypothetical protein